LTSEVFFLHQHPDRIFQEASEHLHELGGICPIADAVVNGDGGYSIYK